MAFYKIPVELQALPQWICWQLVDRGGKPTKLPINPHTGKLASVDKPDTWSTFEQATQAAASFSGIGFVFTADDPYCGIDMDGHVDNDLAAYIGSYTEASQSGTGAHIICRAKLEGTGKRNQQYEIYDSGRYFVMTGSVLNGRDKIIDAQDEVDMFIEHIFPSGGKPKPVIVHTDTQEGLPDSDEDIYERIRESAQAERFADLWEGGGDHGSASEGDAALLSMLRFWTGGDKARSLRMFGDSTRGDRPKWQRKDYRERTWASIDSGEVWCDPVEQHFREMDAEAATAPAKAMPKSFVEADLAPWRKVSLSDVQAAIDGSILADVIGIMRTPCANLLPYEIGLAKALPFVGACLCGERDDLPVTVLQTRRGIDRARLKIATAQGQAMNVWCMLVAGSGIGKDIGGLVPRVLGPRGLLLGSAGSEEGIADALVERGNGMMSISEFKNWVDKQHWQSKAASFLTGAFNDGSFRHVMSRRGKDSAPAREAHYCYPSIIANCQPETLQAVAKSADITTGFLGRFIFVSFDNPQWVAYAKTGYDIDYYARQLDHIADELATVSGVITPDGDYYAKRMNDMFIGHKAGLRPVWTRLTGEYLLRIAVMLQIRFGRPLGETIEPEIIARAEVVCQWLFASAERALGGVCDDERQGAYERNIERLLELVRGAGGEITLSDVHRNFGRGTKTRDRKDLIDEAATRGLVTLRKDSRTTIITVV